MSPGDAPRPALDRWFERAFGDDQPGHLGTGWASGVASVFHHWRHAADPRARDRNFAVHLPWLDRLFGTSHFPKDAWPAEYGLGDGDSMPEGYLGQLVHPFGRRPGSA